MKRIKVFFLLVVALMVIGFSSCQRRERLYVFNWAYYMPAEVIRLFEKEYNVRVVLDEYASNEEMFAKIRVTGGNQYDLIFPSEDYTAIMINLGLLAPIDYNKIPNLRNIDRYWLRNSPDPEMRFSVPYCYGAAGIIVNTTRVPEFERSWTIFEREDLRGRMTLLDDMRETMSSALIRLGYYPNSVVPEELHAARDLINNRWKPNIVRFDGDMYGRGFVNGDFWVSHGYPENVFLEMDGCEVLLSNSVFFFPVEGFTAYLDSMVIPRGSRNVELAHKFINFIHRPDIYAIFVNEFGLPSIINIPARNYKVGKEWYSIEDLRGSTLKHDLGEDLTLWTDIWFNDIRPGH